MSTPNNMRTPLKRVPINFPNEFSTIKKASIMRNTFCSPPSYQKINPRKNQTIDTQTPIITNGPKYSIESLNDSNSFNLNVSTSTQIDVPTFVLPTLKEYVFLLFQLNDTYANLINNISLGNLKKLNAVNTYKNFMLCMSY